MATVGGAEVLGLEHLCGNFKPGKQLDALVVIFVVMEWGLILDIAFGGV